MIAADHVRVLVDLHESTTPLDGTGPRRPPAESGLQTCWRPPSATTTERVPTGTLLRWIEQTYGADPSGRRNVASAGALHPLRFYVLQPSCGMPAEVIESVGGRRPVRTWQEGTIEGLALVDRSMGGGRGTLCVIAPDLDQPGFKYGPRGYRFVLMEAGAAAHEITRLAARDQVRARTLGAFDDVALGRSLGIARSSVVPIAVLAFQGMG